jgi:hypothetical protein
MHLVEQVLLGVTLIAFLAGVLAIIYKGGRPLQPVPENPTAPRKAAFAALVSLVCAFILYATFKGLDLYMRNHFSPPPRPVVILICGVIAPWCGGIYFAYRAARAANKALRAVGAVEVLIFLVAAALVLISGG